MIAAIPTLLLWLDEASAIEADLVPLLPPGRVRILKSPNGVLPSEEVLASVDIVFGWDLPASVLSRMPNLRWIQAATAGVENWITRPDLRPDVLLTCARVHRVQMPENILASLFHITKDFAGCRERQVRHEWLRITFDLLAGKTLGIIGLGSIGSELARKASALEMRVIGVRKTVQPTPFVDVVYPLIELDALLSDSDFVVLVVPVTPDTEGLIDARRLSRMKPHAWLLNFARGEVVVDEDLVNAVKCKNIAGAVLDAFRQEPLPAEHPFWSVPGIVVLPHIGGRHPHKHRAFAELLADNIARYLAGNSLSGVVEPASGY